MASSAACLADTLINIPIGRKIPYKVFRLEGRFDQGDLSQFTTNLDYGIDTNFDTRLTYQDLDGQRRVVTGDLSYNYVSPIVGLLPGLSVGIQDIANKTLDGRRPYFASTYQVGGSPMVDPVELTLGFNYTNRFKSFVGLMFPFTQQLRFLAEDDGHRVNAGVEWRQNESISFRWIFQDSKPQLGVRWQTRL